MIERTEGIRIYETSEVTVDVFLHKLSIIVLEIRKLRKIQLDFVGFVQSALQYLGGNG